MDTVKVSPKFQVVIPLAVRKALKVIPREIFQVLTYEGRIQLVPVRDLKKMRGFLKGLKTNLPRKKER